MAALASYLKISGSDDFGQTFGFQNVRETVGYEAIASSFSLCPVVTIGSEGVSSRDYRSLPYSAEPISGADWRCAVGLADRIPVLPSFPH